MRPEDMGFAEPCVHCSSCQWITLQSYENSQFTPDWDQIFQVHDYLTGSWSGVDCRRCGCCWDINDGDPRYGWWHVGQLSRDGAYYRSGHYEKGKRHG